MGAEHIRVHVWIEGHVQGVFFRASTRSYAHALGVSGWVRNLPDGRVEAVFEGPRPAVEKVVAWCRRGPQDANVTSLTEAHEAVEGTVGFSVL